MQKNRLILITMLIISTVALTLFFVSGGLSNNSQIDNFPEEGLGIDVTSQANIINGEDLLLELGGVQSFDFLREDLFVFANVAYEPYTKNLTDLVGFDVKSTENKDGTVLVTGRFGSSKNNVEVVIEKLKLNRIKTSITDTKTKLNIDSDLPSNSRVNQFIGTLPISGNNYEIDYFSESDSFLINVFNSPGGNDEAEALIKSAIGEDKFSEINIVRYGVGFGSGGSNFGL